MATFAAAYAMKERLSRSMLKHPNIQGIGVGFRDPKQPKKGAAVIIFAAATSAASLGISSALAKRAVRSRADVPILVMKTDKLYTHANYRRRIRPIPAGYSIGTKNGSGTMGLVVTNFPKANQRYIFSNNHVLTNPINSRRRVKTLQPGGADRGRSGIDCVGRLSRYTLLRRKGSNFIDAAVSTPVRNSILNPRYAEVGVLPGHATSYRVGDRFKKVGRTTGLVYGKVISVHTDVQVDYGGSLGVITFRNQTVIKGTRPISLPGDSGSVWLRRSDNYATAVNYAGTLDGLTSIAYPVDWFMRRYRMRTARPRGAGKVRNVTAKNDQCAYARRLTEKELKSIRLIEK